MSLNRMFAARQAPSRKETDPRGWCCAAATSGQGDGDQSEERNYLSGEFTMGVLNTLCVICPLIYGKHLLKGRRNRNLTGYRFQSGSRMLPPIGCSC